LLIDTDRDKSTGWNGYDYIVNRVSPKGDKVILEKNLKGKWMWKKVAESRFAVSGNKMEFAINKINMKLNGSEVDVEFKWSDNMQSEGDIMDFYINGDVAPGGRFPADVLIMYILQNNKGINQKK